jgi:hypothetical protein
LWAVNEYKRAGPRQSHPAARGVAIISYSFPLVTKHDHETDNVLVSYMMLSMPA